MRYFRNPSGIDVTPEFHRLDDPTDGIARELAAGVSARIFAGANSMLSVVVLAPHAEAPLHNHSQEQWGVLLDGTGTRFQDGVAVPVRTGDFWRTPSNVPHGFTAGAAGAKILDIFSPPRKEYSP